MLFLNFLQMHLFKICFILFANLEISQSWRKSVLNIHWKDLGWAETPILWPSDEKNWLIGKDPDAGKDRRQEEKGMTEDGMVGRHHWLDGHEFEQALGVGDRQWNLVCCSPWGHKESDTTEGLDWTEAWDIKYSLLFPKIIYFD